jgi:hypothetical protein
MKTEMDLILKRSEAIQKEMHAMINSVKRTKKGKIIPYEDLVTVFFCMKLAELQNKLDNQPLIMKN